MATTQQTIPPFGMIGLGRMGANLVRRVVRAGGTKVSVYDTSAKPGLALQDELDPSGDGSLITVASNLSELVDSLPSPRIIWVMVPAGVVDKVIEELGGLLESGDIVIDGGNSDWRHDSARADLLGNHGVALVDAGTSGGVWGLERGYCLMVGGTDAAVPTVAPILSAIAPAPDSVPRTPERSGDLAPSEMGWLYCGPTGAGHFVKMVHNGIEYGIMAAYAEGLNVLGSAGSYGFDLDQGDVAELWRRGSVIGSWLLDLTASALAKSPSLDGFSGYVDDNGEGRWTLEAGVDLGVPMPVLAGALFGRFSSRGNDLGANKLLSAMRNEFGGHVESNNAQATDNVERKAQ